jgi:hypothetical protein
VATTAYRRRLLSCLRYDADDVCLTFTRNAGALGAGFRSVAVTLQPVQRRPRARSVSDRQPSAPSGVFNREMISESIRSMSWVIPSAAIACMVSELDRPICGD